MEKLSTTRPFITGRSQAVRIPKEFRFDENEELVLNRVGDSIIITPKRALASTFLSGVNMLDDDFLAEGRPGELPTARETLD